MEDRAALGKDRKQEEMDEGDKGRKEEGARARIRKREEDDESEEGREGKRKPSVSLDKELEAMRGIEMEKMEKKETEKKGKTTKNIIDDLTRKIEEMVGLIQQNTAVPLKNRIREFHGGIKGLRRIYEKEEREREEKMYLLNTQIDKIQSNIEMRVELGKKMTEKAEKGTQTQINKKEIATQTNIERMFTLQRTVEKYEEFKTVKEEKWTKESYENTEVLIGNPLHAKDSTVLVVLADPGDPRMERGIQRKFKERYPEIEDIEENIGIIEQTHKIKTKGQSETRRRKIIKITCKGTDEDLFESFRLLREEVKDDERISCHTIKERDTNTIRKIIESNFHGTKTRVVIYVPEMEKIKTVEKQERKTYAFVVENKDKSYTDTLKEVKERLQKGNIGEGIKSIRSTREGKLLVVMDKDKDKIEKIKEAIVENKEMKVKQLRDGDTDTIHIRGMDALVEKCEVQKAIEEMVGEGRYDLKMGELRPMRDETMAITIKMERKGAEMLLRQGNIKIGYARCNLEKRVEIQRCYRCWGHGHSSKDCSGPDRVKLCFRCGKEGHAAKDCKNEEYCPICEHSGHRAGSGRCENFKKELNTRRRAERQVWRKEWAKETKQAQQTQITN
ncbi:uncharacterized protein [Onthophagus taurus]|uniref:uncharacterized protein n=1 Tax=Onthophagus taurus TaxID=166361 RepID=UPI0039BEAFCD